VTAAAPCTLTADEHLLSRAIGNLIDNALRHTPEHGRIDLHCARTDNEAIFTITDTGPGIAPADVPHLFADRDAWRSAFHAGTRASKARVSATTRPLNSGSRMSVEPFIDRPFSS
jgi:K+-sensing histidine kinase KdpD